MDVPNLTTLEQEWRAFMSAPYIIIAPVAFASWLCWWLRGIKSERRIDGLEGQLKCAAIKSDEIIAGLKGRVATFEDRLKGAAEKVELANLAKAEVERQFNDLKADISATTGSGTLSDRVAKIEVAIEKLSNANKAVGVAIAVGVSEAVGFGDKVDAVLIRGRLNDNAT